MRTKRKTDKGNVMKYEHNAENIILVETHKVCSEISEVFTDSLSVEEPLEIQIEMMVDGTTVTRTVAVTMRTPGNDSELAAGFLFTEGVISSAEQIARITREKCNVMKIALKGGVQIDLESLDRHSFVASSCGVCGKKSIAAVLKRCEFRMESGTPSVRAATISTLSKSLRLMQSDFDTTGGIHAAALFTNSGRLIELREDVGRHNALDKLIGTLFLRDQLPLSDCILFLSGRASFELIQKAATAGIPIVAAVGAPSSLAVELASGSGMTLLGFVRENRFNIYCGSERVACASERALV